eukprot:3412610-Prymnesium_polylepis.1
MLFDFSTSSSAGWSTGGGNPPYAFTRLSGGTPSGSTGPLSGAGGSGYYYFAETSSPRSQGDRFALAYDGSLCASTGQIATVTFSYHMYGATTGTMRVLTAAGTPVWSASGNQGNTWHTGTASIYSASFQFEYRRGSSYTGDAAIDQVGVTC